MSTDRPASDFAWSNEIAQQYLLSNEIVRRAIQDPGKTNTKSARKETIYPKVKALAAQYYDHFKEKGFPNLPANKSRTTDLITTLLINLRKQMDKTSVREDFRLYSTADSSKVYIICNDDNAGQLILLSMLLNQWSSQQQKNQVKRTPSIAIRLVAACLHDSHRGFMVKYLKGRKDRDEQDQSNNTSMGGFDVILDTFLDSSLSIERPAEMDLNSVDPKQKIDPLTACVPDGINNVVEWLESVWVDYIKPKYRHILRKWYKETGGGSRMLANFVNYCQLRDGNYPWMVWVYFLDSKSDLLLASSARGRPPWLSVAEAGFENDTADVADESLDKEESSTRKKKRKTESIMEELEEGRKKLQGLFEKADRLLESKIKPVEEEGDEVFRLIAKYDSVS